MALSPPSVEILLDLLEIKMGYMHIQDRDDAKELLKLRYCRQELLKMLDANATTSTSCEGGGQGKNSQKTARETTRILRRQQTQS